MVLALAFAVMRVAPRGPVFITAATLIFAVTFNVDRSTVQFDEILHDREPKPQTAVRSRHRTVGLEESLENMRRELAY